VKNPVLIIIAKQPQVGTTKTRLSPPLELSAAAELFEALLLDTTRVLAFNSDGPSLPREYLQDALLLLDDHELVFGPSTDGGYYLVGLKRPHPQLFTGIQWSTPRVLEDSLAKAGQGNLPVALLPQWYDVDTAEDLKRLLQDIHTYPADLLKHTRRFFERLPPELVSTLAD
jgi:glycosyltransferase A (GT-A) superfamily protein (DUF2064 family)